MFAIIIASTIMGKPNLTTCPKNRKHYKYRNLIHPGKEIREKMIFDRTDAELAKTVVEIIIREVRTWSLAEQCRKKLSEYLSAINQNERELIQLFSLPPTTELGQFDHPFLRHEVYQATQSLIKNGVLKMVKDNQTDNNQEKICLLPDAIELIEAIVIKEKIQRDSVVLDDRNIAASGMSGSGSRPSAA